MLTVILHLSPELASSAIFSAGCRNLLVQTRSGSKRLRGCFSNASSFKRGLGLLKMKGLGVDIRQV